MRRWLVGLVVVGFFLSADITASQGDNEVCGPQDIQARVNTAYEAYTSTQSASTTKQEALDDASRLSTAIVRTVETCANVQTAEDGTVAEDPGNGTLERPYAFGTRADGGNGFDLQITGFIKPADRIVMNTNRFNTRPAADQVYIILELTVYCQLNTSRCDSNYFNYELVGDKGVIYTYESVVLDDKLDVNLLGGSQGTGRLVFLVRKDDTNLRLIYKANRFRDEMIVFAAEPSLENSIQVTASTNLNVRSGPGTNYGTVDSLQAASPVIATGRNENGSWVQTSTGWVFAELLTVNGDVMSLPITAP